MLINLARLFQWNFEAAIENVERTAANIRKKASQSSSFEFELLKNTDQPTAIILVRVDTYCFNCFVRCYHAYIDNWNPQPCDNDVEIKYEWNNDHGEFASNIFHSKGVRGHVLKNLSKLLYQFFPLSNFTITCEFTDKLLNRRGAYGLEILVNYKFFGSGKGMSWIQINVNKTIIDLLPKICHCMFW